MIVGGALLLDRVANSIFITWRPDEEFQPGAPIGLERVLTRVDVALRPRWPALKANPPPCSPFFFLLPQISRQQWLEPWRASTERKAAGFGHNPETALVRTIMVKKNVILIQNQSLDEAQEFKSEQRRRSQKRVSGAPTSQR